MPINWFYNHNGFSQLDAQSAFSVFNQSFQKWTVPSCTGIQFRFSGTTTNKWDSRDQQNVMIWNPQIPDSNFPTALALTIPLYNNQGVYFDADIIYNGGYSWSPNPSANQFDMFGTVTHEVGHLIGLDHTNVQNATMFPTASPGLCPCRTLKQDDINGVCSLYPGSGGSKPKRQLGQPCDQTNVCDTDLTCLVYQSNATSGVCHKLCPNGVCLSGEKCYSLSNGQGACACRTDADCSNGKTCNNFFCSGTTTQPNQKKKLGESCDENNLCDTGLTCVQLQANATTGVCFNTCPNGTCAGGEKCYELTNGEKACVCQSNAECANGGTCNNFRCQAGQTQGGKEGEACDAQGNCQTGLQCVSDPQSNQTLCIRPCATNADCVGGFECNTQFGVCMPPPQQGTQDRGQPCDTQRLCKQGLECIVIQQGAQSGVCLPNCQGTCTGGERCVPTNGNTSICVCLQNDQCPAGKNCQDYRCVDAPGCTTDAECGTGRVCQQGKCAARTGCQSNADCSPGTTCQNGGCVAIPTPQGNCIPSCAPGFDCINGSCIYKNECATDNDCNSNEKCQQGACTPVPVPDRPSTQPPIDKGCGGCTTSTTPLTPAGLGLFLLLWMLIARRRQRPL